MESLDISVDFDGTIVESGYPGIGKPKPYAFEVLKALQKIGHRLILNTCREDHPTNINKRYLTDAINFCANHGVVFRSVNETLLEDDFRPSGSKRRKVFADVYVDDCNWPITDIDWKAIGASFGINV